MECSMKKSLLIFLAGLVLGAGLGVLVWHKRFVGPLSDENVSLREESKAAAALRLENARLAAERVDPDELKRLREGQTELLRLRGQAARLKRDADEARATASRTTSPTQQTPTDASTDSPVETYTAKVSGTVGKGQSLVTGGWKTETGKRVFMVMLPSPNESDNTVLVRAQIVEVPDQFVASLGLDGLKTDGAASTGNGIFSAEDTAKLLANLKSQEGVTILSAPQVITASGMQARVSVTESRELPGGKSYSTGPVVSLTPTLSGNRQQVDLVVDAQLNLPKSPR